MAAFPHTNQLDLRMMNLSMQNGSMLILLKDRSRLTSYKQISDPIFDKDTGLPKYKLGQKVGHDFWIWTEEMTVSELNAEFEVFTLDNSVLS